jgi:hypothetical protein
MDGGRYDCMDAGGTPPGMEAVDRVGNKRSRATPGAVAGMAEVLETQEQFPVQAGIQDVDEIIDLNFLDVGFQRCD